MTISIEMMKNVDTDDSLSSTRDPDIYIRWRYLKK